MQMGEKAHLRTMAAVLANTTATTLVYPSVHGPAWARRPREPAGRRRPAGRRPPGPAPACGPHCSRSICFTGTVLTTCLPRVCFIATAVRRSHSSGYYYYYYSLCPLLHLTIFRGHPFELRYHFIELRYHFRITFWFSRKLLIKLSRLSQCLLISSSHISK